MQYNVKMQWLLWKHVQNRINRIHHVRQYLIRSLDQKVSTIIKLAFGFLKFIQPAQIWLHHDRQPANGDPFSFWRQYKFLLDIWILPGFWFIALVEWINLIHTVKTLINQMEQHITRSQILGYTKVSMISWLQTGE